MLKLDIIDETFDRDRTSSYELSIQVSLNGFSYAVRDTIRNTFIALFNTDWNGFTADRIDYRSFLDKLIEDKPWLRATFKNVIAAFDLPYLTLIPSEYFDPNLSKKVLEQVHSIPDSFELGYKEFKHLSGFMVYAAPSEFINAWRMLHGNTYFTHSLQSFVHIPHSQNSKTYLQVDVNHQQLILVLHRNGELLAANMYSCKATSDIVYYAYAMAKSVDVGMTDPLHVNLTGNGELMVGLPDELGKYFNSLSHQAEFYKPVFFSYKLLRFRTEFFRLFNLGVTCE